MANMLRCRSLVIAVVKYVCWCSCYDSRGSKAIIRVRLCVILCVCLYVCPQHNSKTYDPKIFKLGVGNANSCWPRVPRVSTQKLELIAPVLFELLCKQ